MTHTTTTRGGEMDIKSLAQLQQFDERSGFFTPAGRDGQRGAEAAAIYHQQLIAHLDLADAVPQDVRKNFERLRTLYSYGVLCYDLYTVAHDDSRLVLEHALRERFAEFYGGAVAFVDARRAVHTITYERFDQVYDQIRTDHRLSKPHKWRLRLTTGRQIFFDGMLDSLLRWARGEGLLHGESNRHREKLLNRFRIRVAHPSAYHLLPPDDAARALGDLAELVNHLWGADTPGGRFYPAPVQRDIVALGWSADGNAVTWPSAKYLRQLPDEWTGPQMTFLLVLAHPHDDQVAYFDARHEATHYPCRWLWGPGTWQDAVTWLEREQPGGDQVDILDRHFMVRHHDGRLYLPSHPEIAAALPAEEHSGTWYLVRADSPLPVFNHLRQSLAGGFGCTKHGPCTHCPVDTLLEGTWQQALDRLAELGEPAVARHVPDVRVPSGWPRWNEHIGGGTWSVPNG